MNFLKRILTKQKIFGLFFVLAGIIYLVGNYAATVCHGDDNCLSTLSSVAGPLFLVLALGTLISFLLLALQEKVIFTWLSFFLPLSILYLFVIIGAPVSDGGYIGPSSREIYSVLGEYLLIAISFLIILIKSIQVYRKKK